MRLIEVGPHAWIDPGKVVAVVSAKHGDKEGCDIRLSIPSYVTRGKFPEISLDFVGYFVPLPAEAVAKKINRALPWWKRLL